MDRSLAWPIRRPGLGLGSGASDAKKQGTRTAVKATSAATVAVLGF